MITFQLISLDGIQFDQPVYEVLLPTLDGIIGVMPGHMPLVSVAKAGVVSVRYKSSDRDEQMEEFAISGGVVEVDHNTLRVLVDGADKATEINEQEAQQAIELAKKMQAEAKDQLSLQKAQELIDRHTVRLHLASLRRNKRNR